MTDNLPEVAEKSPDLLSVISRAAADPAVDVLKMEALLRLQREIMTDHARAEFNAAFTRLTNRIPRVPKTGVITIPNKGSYAFAKFEDMNRILQPILSEEGMGITFSTRHENGGVVVIGSLVHREGHSRDAEMWVPPDASGSGTGRNQLQALGSAVSYGKRYVTEMLLNIVREGVDDDGSGGAPMRRGRVPAGFRPQPPPPPPSAKPAAKAPAEPADDDLVHAAWEAADEGTEAFRALWRSLGSEARDALRPLLGELKERAADRDQLHALEGDRV